MLDQVQCISISISIERPLDQGRAGHGANQMIIRIKMTTGVSMMMRDPERRNGIAEAKTL